MPLVEPVPGRFCWFELGTLDRADAVGFYEKVFGWTHVDTPNGPDGVYTIMRLGEQDVAAAYALLPDMRAAGVGPHWMVYVSVADADATAARVNGLGGKVVQAPFEAGPNGRMAVLQDPSGAMFSIWQGRTNMGVRLVGDPGTAVWADLVTGQQLRAVTFYGALFGWRLVGGKNMAIAKAGDYAHIVNGDTFIGGIQPDHQGAPPHWLTYFEVTDLDATLGTIASLGGAVRMPPMALERARRFAVAVDPQGATFALVEHRPGA
jgi:hypothetical protein